MPIHLGPFELQRPIGQGGMGEVWRATHTEQAFPVAVKVMTAKVFEKEENRTRFNQEVRAVAQLDHNGIVWVFDYGVVDAAAATASQGRLIEGSPYLAMEHASGGTLRSLRRPMMWPELRQTLLELLDALGHAHAHGIIHRDLKPANVLLCGARDMRPGVKLTDFGIASAEVEDNEHTDEVVGTLHYMAPEQIRGDDWMQGPHTDLYGLGCLAWRLICGAVPFSGKSGVQLLAAQLHKRLPPLHPMMPVPDGLAAWVAALTAKNPGDRFRRAADARAALLDLPEPTGSSTPPPINRTRRPRSTDLTRPLVTSSTASQILEDQATVLAVPRLKDKVAAREDHALALLRPPLPDDWRLATTQRTSVRLQGAGLGLFGVRAVPMVGRDHERDRLWNRVAEVKNTGHAQLMLIRGQAGSGKSRLAEWLAKRVHEVGGASVLLARFQRTMAGPTPLDRMLRRSLRLQQDATAGDALLDELVRTWRIESGSIREALHTLLDPEALRGLDRTTRHALLRQVLEGMARERTLVMWLDDVQWGLDGLQFVESLLAGDALRPLPVLIVMTARDEALVQNEQESVLLHSLLEHPHAESMDLPSLSRSERARLVQELLGLEPALGAAVEERSAGNPLFAVQLIGNWVQQGLLVPTDAGFVLKEGASRRLPDDLTEVWSQRIDRLVEGLPQGARSLLELAAVIGPEVDKAEWRRVCDGDEIIPRNELIRRALQERLLSSQLATEADSGWFFAHGLLQETLLDTARDNGRYQAHNRATAWMLMAHNGDQNERVGLHLLRAGEADAAVEPLLVGIAERRRTVGRRSALRLIHKVEETQVLTEDDRRWGALQLEKAITLELLGRPEAQSVAQHLFETSTRKGWRELRGRAAARLGRIERLAGRLETATEWLERGLADIRDLRTRADVAYELGRTARSRLQPDDAARYDTLTLRLLEEIGDDDAMTRAALQRAEGAWFDKDWQAVEQHARRGLDVATDLGVRSKLWNLMAEAARRREQTEDAIIALNEAIEIADVIGQGQSPILRANLALVHLVREDFQQADRVLHEALYAARASNLPPVLSILHALLMTTSAGTGRWTSFDDHAKHAEALQAQLPVGEADCAESLMRAAQLAENAGHSKRATRAKKLANDHWKKLGR